MVTGILGSRFPGEYTFLNRGVGGNRIADIKERNARDVIAEKPDYVGFLAGVNDVWYYLDNAANTGGSAYWLMDGIHPTSPAHYLIALKWAEAFETNFLKDRE